MNKSIYILSLVALAFSEPQQSYTDRSRHGREFIGGSSTFTNQLPVGFPHSVTTNNGNQHHLGSGFSHGVSTHTGSLNRGSFSHGASVHSGIHNQFQRRQYHGAPVIEILRESRQGSPDGSYSFEYESADGTSRYERGTPNAYGAVVKEGGWTVNYPDGTSATFTYRADENGFHVESSALPQGPPIPPHAQEQIDRAARERAQGIVHDGQYHPELYDQPRRFNQHSESRAFRPLVHRNNQIFGSHGTQNHGVFGTKETHNGVIFRGDDRNQAIFRQQDYGTNNNLDFNRNNRFNQFDQY